MLIARRGMTLDGQNVEAGQVLDGIWPALRERTRRALLGASWVEEVSAPVAADPEPQDSVAEATPPKKKRGRPRKTK